MLIDGPDVSLKGSPAAFLNEVNKMIAVRATVVFPTAIATPYRPARAKPPQIATPIKMITGNVFLFFLFLGHIFKLSTKKAFSPNIIFSKIIFKRYFALQNSKIKN